MREDTVVRAETLVSAYDQGVVPGTRQYMYVWHLAALIYAASIVAERSAGAKASVRRLVRRMERLWVERVEAYAPARASKDFYYDDNAWVGLGLVKAWRVMVDDSLLWRSRCVWEFVLTGWYERGGGLWWRYGENVTTNTCTHGSSCVLSLVLCEAGIRGTLRWSERIYEAARVLRRRDGLYEDSIRVDGRRDVSLRSYNTGLMISAAVRLWQITGREEYRKEAAQSIDAACQSAASASWSRSPEDKWFDTVLLRGVLEAHRSGLRLTERQLRLVGAEQVRLTGLGVHSPLEAAAQVELLLMQQGMVDLNVGDASAGAPLGGWRQV